MIKIQNSENISKIEQKSSTRVDSSKQGRHSSRLERRTRVFYVNPLARKMVFKPKNSLIHPIASEEAPIILLNLLPLA